MRFKEYECVRIKKVLSGAGALSEKPISLPAGEVGTVMGVRDGVYEVEVIWPYGEVVDGDIFHLREDELEPAPENVV